jgi:CheY-like chemotaxis protein/thiamine kinase-like enzyme
MNKVKIAILENNVVKQVDVRDSYKNLLEDFFSCEFIEFSDQNKLIEYIENNIVDIIVSDLSLGNKEDFNGLNLVRSIKDRYPEILVIGNSAGAPNYRQTSSKLPTFDIYIDKAKLFNMSSDSDYEKHIKDLIEIKFNKNIFVEIKEDSEISEKFQNRENRDLTSIIQQCTYTGISNNKDNPFINYVTLRPLTGGRSESDVYKLTASLPDPQNDCLPAVLKISTHEKAKKELQNYNRFVKWLLPYTWRVDILGVGFTKKWGAICYSFVLSNQEKFDSLTYYIEKKNNDVIEHVYNQIFATDKQKWYRIIREEESISKRYFERYFNCGDGTKETNSFKTYIQQFFTDTMYDANEVTVDKQKYPIPYDCLFTEKHNQKYAICIIHGDLNGNNIIISENKQILFIDFQDTGFGHVFEDFIALECSIRLSYPIEVNKSKSIDYLNFELNIENDFETSFDSKYKEHINNIRKLAFENFKTEDKKNYYYGLAAYAFRLLRLDLTDEQKIKITACLLSGLKKMN